MKRSSFFPTAALVLLACSDSPLSPPDNKEMLSNEMLSGGVSLSVAANAGSLDFEADLSTITASVLPGFTDADAAEQLRIHLGELSNALKAGDKAEAGRVLGLAREVATPDVSNPTDLGYIDVVFSNIDAALR